MDIETNTAQTLQHICIHYICNCCACAVRVCVRVRVHVLYVHKTAETFVTFTPVC